MDLSKLFLSQLLLVVVVCILTSVVSSSSDSDYYKLLGVPKDASDRQIKRAFRDLAMKYHPDKNPDPEARKHFEKIANAYDVLSDSEKRRHYDMYGAEGPQASQGSPFDYDTFFTPGGGFGDHRFHFNFDNLFKDFFGEDDGDDSGFFQFHHTDNHNPHSHSFFSFDTNQGDEDSLFSNPFGGGFDGGFGGFHGFHSEAAYSQQGQAHRSCRTVTKREGNTVTTYTTCS